jgi:hypothetical protein
MWKTVADATAAILNQ